MTKEERSALDSGAKLIVAARHKWVGKFQLSASFRSATPLVLDKFTKARCIQWKKMEKGSYMFLMCPVIGLAENTPNPSCQLDAFKLQTLQHRIEVPKQQKAVIAQKNFASGEKIFVISKFHRTLWLLTSSFQNLHLQTQAECMWAQRLKVIEAHFYTYHMICIHNHNIS